MKNIFLVPTDKPSRLHTWINGKGLRATLYNLPQLEEPNTGKNIYITDDSEIKEGDLYLNTLKNTIDKCEDIISQKNVNLSSWLKKIILTTDPKLIEAGVQPIDDDFLEWFVKNSSCEKVEVIKEYKDGYGNWYKFQDDFKFKDLAIRHKIISPQEEPKQRLEKYSERFDNKDNELVEGVFNPENWGKRLVKEEPKQETLEETAEIFVNNRFTKQIKGEDIYASKSSIIESHILFAKWQKEQYTIEEQHVGHSIDELSKEYIKGFNEGSAFEKQQAEKHLYSEEDMKKYANYVSAHNKSNKWEFPLSPKEWFKQFKK